jgi:hypothetical protein
MWAVGSGGAGTATPPPNRERTGAETACPSQAEKMDKETRKLHYFK